MKAIQMLKFSGLVVLALLLSAPYADSSWAMGLKEAKAAGLVGEKSDGYLGVVGAASDEVGQLVRSINAKRKSYYQSAARRAGASLSSVESRGGATAMRKTPKGQYIQSGGRWVKK